MAEVFYLGGAPYAAPPVTTFEQDAHTMGVVYAAKLHDVITSGGDVLGAVLSSGRVPDLLAGLLVPLDTPWSPAVAKLTRDAVARCTDPAEKAALQSVLESILHGFFIEGAKSSASSPRSSSPNPSTPAPDAAPQKRRPRRRRAPAPTPTSETGPMS